MIFFFFFINWQGIVVETVKATNSMQQKQRDDIPISSWLWHSTNLQVGPGLTLSTSPPSVFKNNLTFLLSFTMGFIPVTSVIQHRCPKSKYLFIFPYVFCLTLLRSKSIYLWTISWLQLIKLMCEVSTVVKYSINIPTSSLWYTSWE